MSRSLYIHIPFCLKKCIYCDFVSSIYDPQKAGAYIHSLKKEILTIPSDVQCSTLYIGGGTPTALSTHELSDLIGHIFRNVNFTENYEATIEANPGTTDKEKLQTILSLGMNRISIGIQSFNDNDLKFLGRIHSSEDAVRAVHLARDTGFENIGIDLIYGIPGQNIVSWRKSLETAAGLKPEHISTYEMTVEEGTLLYEYLQYPPSSSLFKRGDFAFKNVSKTDNLKLSDEEKIIEMYDCTIDYLRSEGYTHYEISNFALHDHFSRHNLNYWDRGEYYGAGLGAHSFIDGKRFCNTDNLDDYIKALSENKSPITESELITEDKSLAEALFLGLRKTEGINVRIFYELYGKNILNLYDKDIEHLLEAGLIELIDIPGSNNLKSSNSLNRSLRLTRKGLSLSNEVFERFI